MDGGGGIIQRRLKINADFHDTQPLHALHTVGGVDYLIYTIYPTGKITHLPDNQKGLNRGGVEVHG